MCDVISPGDSLNQSQYRRRNINVSLKENTLNYLFKCNCYNKTPKYIELFTRSMQTLTCHFL